ncbi:MAG: endonuclease/exonuclease/phosphatase family protein, partial [Pseudomonadota bacterium]
MLQPISEAERAAILQTSRTGAAHRKLMATLPAMNALELGGTANRTTLPARIGVAAWNVERCLFPEETAKHLAPHGLDVILLSEVDNGMSRTGQRNTTAEMASALGCAYAFGVEFFEMDLGGPTERAFCKDDFNAFGWHGNSILSTAPFQATQLIRLDQDGYWFCTGPGSAGNEEQPRVGGRMAVAAIIESEAEPICFVSTHLESNSGHEFRHAQFTVLLDAIDAFAPGLPVLIGGDLNTGNHLPPDFDWRNETLFALAEARGYRWDLTAEGTTTRPSLITPHPGRKMKLDWFASRRLPGSSRPTLSSVDATGRPLSDHDCMLCDIAPGSIGWLKAQNIPMSA